MLSYVSQGVTVDPQALQGQAEGAESAGRGGEVVRSWALLRQIQQEVGPFWATASGLLKGALRFERRGGGHGWDPALVLIPVLTVAAVAVKETFV